MKCLACQTFDLQTKALLVPVKVLQQDLLGLSVVVIDGADSARFLLPVKETIALQRQIVYWTKLLERT